MKEETDGEKKIQIATKLMTFLGFTKFVLNKVNH